MSRQETTIEERGEPSLIYLRRANSSTPIELVIVERGRSTIWQVSSARLLRMVADGAGFLAGSAKL